MFAIIFDELDSTRFFFIFSCYPCRDLCLRCLVCTLSNWSNHLYGSVSFHSEFGWQRSHFIRKIMSIKKKHEFQTNANIFETIKIVCTQLFLYVSRAFCTLLFHFFMDPYMIQCKLPEQNPLNRCPFRQRISMSAFDAYFYQSIS